MLKTLPVLAAAAVMQMVTPAPSQAGKDAGAYLAARQAAHVNDFAAAAEHFTRALVKNASNPAVMEQAVVALLALGQPDRALPVARKIEADGLRSQVANMVLIGDEVQRGDWVALLQRIEDNRGVGDLADGLMAAWASLGAGDVKTALDGFDEVAGRNGLRGFAIYHKALALASVGDFESADKIYSGESEGPMQRTRRGTIAWAQVLSQLERNEQAVAIIDDTFGTDLDPEIQQLRNRLAAGESVPFSLITSPKDGIAEVFFSLGQALMNDAGGEYVLLYSRMAEALKPLHVDAILMSAGLLEELDRYELAVETYGRVPRDHGAFNAAELGRAEALRRSGKIDAAAEVLNQLAQSYPDLPLVHVSAGDLYRQNSQFAQAVTAYDRALELYAERDTDQWFVYYVRGISYERLGKWPQAEADFRRALELKPDQPQVLNYLGYSLVEKRIKLDEALDMIERAVAAEPNSGYIVDSLGWVLYRLGRYDEAVAHMERAAELMPVDPVVNDHLGDVLWAVGRFNEAEFQWRRALSFIDEAEDLSSLDVDPDRIRRKLEVGLDKVLEEEGTSLVEMAGDGG